MPSPMSPFGDASGPAFSHAPALSRLPAGFSLSVDEPPAARPDIPGNGTAWGARSPRRLVTASESHCTCFRLRHDGKRLHVRPTVQDVGGGHDVTRGRLHHDNQSGLTLKDRAAAVHKSSRAAAPAGLSARPRFSAVQERESPVVSLLLLCGGDSNLPSAGTPAQNRKTLIAFVARSARPCPWCRLRPFSVRHPRGDPTSRHTLREIADSSPGLSQAMQVCQERPQGPGAKVVDGEAGSSQVPS